MLDNCQDVYEYQQNMVVSTLKENVPPVPLPLIKGDVYDFVVGEI